MEQLIVDALGLSKSQSPALLVLSSQLRKLLKGKMKSILKDARENTAGMEKISEKDVTLLDNKKIWKKIPKNYVEQGSKDFCDNLSCVEVKQKKTKKLLCLDDITCRVLYYYLKKGVVDQLLTTSEVYQKFMSRATKKNLEGWQELSQKIGNFNTYLSNRQKIIDLEISELFKSHIELERETQRILLESKQGKLNADELKALFNRLVQSPNTELITRLITGLTGDSLNVLNATSIGIMNGMGIGLDSKENDIITFSAQQEIALENIEFVQNSLEEGFGINTLNHEIFILLGNSAISIGRPTVAMDHYLKSFTIAQNNRNAQGMCSCKNRIGIANISMGEYTKAIEEFKLALQIAEQLKEPRGITESLNNLGHINRLKGNYAVTLEHYTKAMQYARSTNNANTVAETQCNLALINTLMGETNQAFQMYNQILQFYESQGNMKEVTICLTAIAGIYADANDHDNALTIYDRALKTAEKVHYNAGMGIVLNNIGLLHKSKDDVEEAMKFFRMAIKVSEEINDRKNVATCLNNLSTLYKTKKDYENAMQTAKKALQISEEQQDKRNISTYMNNIGMIYHVQGDTNRAMEYLKKALDISENMGDKSGIAGRLNNMASIHYERKEYDKAMEYLDKALPIFEEIGSPVAATVRENIDTLKKEME